MRIYRPLSCASHTVQTCDSSNLLSLFEASPLCSNIICEYLVCIFFWMSTRIDNTVDNSPSWFYVNLRCFSFHIHVIHELSWYLHKIVESKCVVVNHPKIKSLGIEFSSQTQIYAAFLFIPFYCLSRNRVPSYTDVLGSMRLRQMKRRSHLS